MELYYDSFELPRLLLQRGMGLIYLVAFASAFNQFRPLLGENGLLPVPKFLEQTSFKEHPSLFHYAFSDRLVDLVCWTGILLSLLTVSGLSEAGPVWMSLFIWLILWMLYLSLVNVGQRFYGFGWESMLCEAGFFVSFLGSAQVAAPAIPIIILRWMLFRVELGAGLIKIRHDQCWRDCTCLYYHYETQPIPNPLSWYFHRLPRWFHRVSVAGSHVVQLFLPFGLFAPQPVAAICAALIIFHQLWLIVCGNYSWLNWLTIVLGFAGFSDHMFGSDSPVSLTSGGARPLWFDALLWSVLAVTVYLSIEPAKNLFSDKQRMNYSWNSLHLVNAYGAFGSVTRHRYEVVVEATDEDWLGPETEWKEYEFRGKPTDLSRLPVQLAPYHLRLDWQMWFLPFSARVVGDQVRVVRQERWFIKFLEKLLYADPAVLALLKRAPFGERRPAHIRAQYYLYRYTTPAERAETGNWWKRDLVGTYVGPIRLKTPEEQARS